MVGGGSGKLCQVLQRLSFKGLGKNRVMIKKSAGELGFGEVVHDIPPSQPIIPQPQAIYLSLHIEM